MTKLLRGRGLILAIAWIMAGVILNGCASTDRDGVRKRAADVTAHSLRKFHDEAEFEAYRRELHQAAKAQHLWWAGTGNVSRYDSMLAQNASAPCDPTVDDCKHEAETVAVTGAKVTKPKSITNNQVADVDEGDIVKRLGRFLIVLQDGRLFSIDTGDRAGTLKLVDRVDLYDKDDDDTWFDELLIHDRTLVVTAYSYGQQATETIVVHADESGVFTIQAKYFLQSNDYFSGANYASRLVRGELVFYTPLNLMEQPDHPLEVPKLRRWTPEDGYSEWRPLFEISDVYRPIQQTLWPTLHVIVVCPIDRSARLTCHSRGVIGPSGREMYVSEHAAYLWLPSDYNYWGFGDRSPPSCKDAGGRFADLEAAAYRFPIDSNFVQATFAFGAPVDQFAFDERGSELHALLVRALKGCDSEEPYPLEYVSIPLEQFSSVPTSVGHEAYVTLPAMKYDGLQTRYSERYLVYGSPQGSWYAYWGNRYGDADKYQADALTLVPLSAPSSYRTLPLTHSIERVELLGKNAVVFGYDPSWNFATSTIDLRRWPKRADSNVAPGIVESEGRSHAFNADANDSGVSTFGLPTVMTRRGNENYSGNDTAADVQFFVTDAALRISHIGFLGALPNETDYECEVSCYDWYGNARPIFIDNRVFALTGNELIEGAVMPSAIAEIARLRITDQPEHAR